MKPLKKVVVVGAGGREQAIGLKLAESEEVGQVYLCPSPETPFLSNKMTGLKIDPSHFEDLSEFSLKEKIDLIVIGPEVPLVNGLTDFLEDKGIPVFGPSLKASKLEGSKQFSKSLMEKFKYQRRV